MIGWFSEGLEQRVLNDLVGLVSQSELKGEIAIIANVTEGSLSPGGRNTDGELEGRVVYYSDDMYLDQRMNDFNVPIFGPYRYQGGSLSVDLWIMELDRAESEQMGAVLNTLTSLSASIPSLSGQGVSILGQIGTAFLKSNKDDIIGHIRITFSPPRRNEKTQDPILQVSDVVVSRAAVRSSSRDVFKTCYYHPPSGRVTAGAEATSRPCEDALGSKGDNNILVLGIRKVPEGSDISSQVRLSDLTERLKKAGEAPSIATEIERIGDEARSATAYSAALEALDRIREDPGHAVREVSAGYIIGELQCTLLAQDGELAALLKEVCGGDRAAQRAMSLEDFTRLTRQLTTRLNISPSDLSLANLLGGPPVNKATLKASKQTLIPKFVYKQ